MSLAANGKQALMAFESNIDGFYDIILMDIKCLLWTE